MVSINDTQTLAIAMLTAPNLLMVLVGILIDNARFGDLNTRLGETNARLKHIIEER